MKQSIEVFGFGLDLFGFRIFNVKDLSVIWVFTNFGPIFADSVWVSITHLNYFNNFKIHIHLKFLKI